MIQGMTMTDENHIIFTKSFSNLMQSRIIEYSLDLKEKTDDYYIINNTKIPYYHITKKVKKTYTSPMAEGLFYKDGYIYIIFENSSDNYEFTYRKIRKIIKYKVKST
jgi:hypothetical protein